MRQPLFQFLLKTFLGALFTVGTPALAFAEIALYDGRLPDGYAYVRFANTTNSPINLDAAFAGEIRLGAEEANRISPYRVVENVAGKIFKVVSGSSSVEFSLLPGKFHTVLIDGANQALTGKLVIDVTDYSQSRAKLSFYNAIPTCFEATLILEPSGQSIFPAVATGTMRTRSVKAVDDAKVHAKCGDKATPSLDLGELHEGALYSLWLMAPSGKTITFLAQDFIAPYQK